MTHKYKAVRRILDFVVDSRKKASENFINIPTAFIMELVKINPQVQVDTKKTLKSQSIMSK